MALFKSAEEVYATIGEFFKTVADSEQAKIINSLDTVTQFVYSQPDSILTWIPIKESDRYLEVVFGETDVKPELVFELSADTANQFWLGKVNLTMALSRQQMRATGPLSKALKVVPQLEPWYGQYAQFLRDKGRADLADVE